MLKIFNRYLYKEITHFFLLTAFILTMVSLVGKLLTMVDIIINKGGSLLMLLKLLAYTMPFMLIYTVPIAYLLSILIVFNRLSSDKEMIALKASGISILQLTKPVIKYSVIPFFITLFLTIAAFPWGNRNLKNTIYTIASQGGLSIREKTFNDIFSGLVIYANTASSSGKRLEGIFISDERDRNQPKIITARQGTIFSKEPYQIVLNLQNGTIYTQGKEDVLREISFTKYQVVLHPVELENINKQNRSNRELSISELYQRIERKKTDGENPSPYIIDLHKRFVLPFSIFVFALIAIPLGNHNRKGGGLRGFITGLLLILIYYIISTFAEFLGENGSINPVLAVWSSNIVTAMIGAYLLYQSHHELKNRIVASIEDGLYDLTDRLKAFFLR